MRNTSTLGRTRYRTAAVATALLAAWFTVFASSHEHRAPPVPASAVPAAHVDETHFTAPADYFPARFAAPVGEPAEIPATF